MNHNPATADLPAILRGMGPVAVAVSGGVDSLTLAHAAARAVPGVAMYHAVSPAVPAVATARVRDHAAQGSWTLKVIEAGEFSDPDYLRNPVNRCYFCKSNLYDRIRAETDLPIASGANLDDLGDFRPGLLAARERDVRHPFVEAGMTKVHVRAMARGFGLSDIAELPAQPCMASRIETGLRVEPDDLALVEAVEGAVAALAPGAVVRCRIVAGGVRLELGAGLEDDAEMRVRAEAAARGLCAAAGRALLGVTAYRRGSAFLHG